MSSGVYLIHGKPYASTGLLLQALVEGYRFHHLQVNHHDMGRKVAWTFRWNFEPPPARMAGGRPPLPGTKTFEIEVDQEVRRERGDDLAIGRTRRPAVMQLIRHLSEILGPPRCAIPEEDEPAPPAEAGPLPGDLRVWWIPQVPMEMFLVPVDSVEEAARLVEILASYDAFQFENRVKPDYCNVGGLQIYEEDDGDGNPGWVDWYTADGDDFEEYRRSLSLPDFWSWKG